LSVSINVARRRTILRSVGPVTKLEGPTVTADRMEAVLDEKGERALRIVSTGT
jgi:hypothetical protein